MSITFLLNLILYEHLAGPYDRMNMKDSVISGSKNVSKLYRQYGYKEEASSCWPSAIYVYMEQKKYAEANWWKKTATAGIGEMITIRTANTLRRIVKM